jgi:hypothetical protein
MSEVRTGLAANDFQHALVPGQWPRAMRLGYKTFMRPKLQCKLGFLMLMAEDSTRSLQGIVKSDYLK